MQTGIPAVVDSVNGERVQGPLCLHQVRMFTKVALIFGSAWFAGTTIMPHIYRAFGAKIGKRVTIRTLDLAEADLVEIGDDCVIEVGRAAVPGLQLINVALSRPGIA
jgi:hypothetical protein